MRYGGKRAVVIGASIAGLLAGRVLADFFDEVVLIDKEQLNNGITPRKAVPQGSHVHVILTPTYHVLQRFLPGLIEELVSQGAPVYDAGSDVRVLVLGKSLKNGRTSQPIIGSTRPFFEHYLRRHVMRVPNLTIRSGHRFLHWLADHDRIDGVAVAHDGIECQLKADLVVDARGRASALHTELQDLDFEPPEVDRVGVDIGYTSRTYRAPGLSPTWNLLYLNSFADESWRGGMIARVENNLWVVTQFGYFGEHPPLDDAGFLSFANSLDAPDIADFLEVASPVSACSKIGMRECKMHHFERLARFPDRLLAVGDTVCSLNPVYGQGMTKAANEARFLWHSLDRHLTDLDTLDGLSDSFRRGLPNVGAAWAWQLTTGVDLRSPKAVGERRRLDALMVQYMKRLLLRAADSVDTRSRIFDATMLIKPPQSLLQPKLILRAMGF